MNAADQPPHPRENPDLLGHEAAEQAFLSSWRSGRLHHAWMICGPRGIGKATLAYRIARYVLNTAAAPGLLQDTGMALDPSDPVFHRVAAAGHADLLTLERGYDEKAKKLRSDIVVGDVRAVGGFFAKTAAEGGWRVVVVDAADEMNRNAANALLKVLEEPPARALLLLVAHQPGRLLATIRSRCRRLTLAPMEEGALTTLLARYAPDLADDDRRTLARLSDGSVGRALQLAEAGGLALYREVVALLAGLPDPDPVALHRLAEKVGGAGREEVFRTVSGLLRWWLARMIRAAASGVMPMEAVAGEAEVMSRLAARGSLDHWVELWEKSNDLTAAADGLYLDRKQTLLSVFFMLGDAARG